MENWWETGVNLFLDARAIISYLEMEFPSEFGFSCMISSMTGYGRGEVTENRVTAMAEVRSINSRYLEVMSRLPRTMSLRETDVKEIVRKKFTRGKVNIVVSLSHGNGKDVPLRINAAAARAYYKLLIDLKKSVKIQEKVTLEHLLKFPEVIDIDDFERGDDDEWAIVQKALHIALEEARLMRNREGIELMNDLRHRIQGVDGVLDRIERLSEEQIPHIREHLSERLKELVADQSVIDAKRLELELALFADRLDVTEECVRFRSHNKFFLKSLEEEEGAGRKLNFLVQEMNREANTIGSKANNAEVAHLIVGVKEELEKIREQLQNIE